MNKSGRDLCVAQSDVEYAAKQRGLDAVNISRRRLLGLVKNNVVIVMAIHLHGCREVLRNSFS